MPDSADIMALTARAVEAAEALKVLANEQRLLLLCHLSQGDEVPVGDLVRHSGLPQSSVSQHLARLREGGMVRTRRVGTTIYYSLASNDVRDLIGMLCDRFGKPAHAA